MDIYFDELKLAGRYLSIEMFGLPTPHLPSHRKGFSSQFLTMGFSGCHPLFNRMLSSQPVTE